MIDLFFFQGVGTAMASPVGHTLGPSAIGVRVVGALIIGAMVRYRSERIRGRGIPKASEAILINGSRVQPRVALLKPLSSATSGGDTLLLKTCDHADKPGRPELVKVRRAVAQ